MTEGCGNIRYKLWNQVDHLDHGLVDGDFKKGIYTLETPVKSGLISWKQLFNHMSESAWTALLCHSAGLDYVLFLTDRMVDALAQIYAPYCCDHHS